MADRWQTLTVESAGGILEKVSVLSQAKNAPGSLLQGQNFEKARGKGYRRINGHQKYSSTALSGTGKVLGVFSFNGSVIGCRGANIEIGSGTTWTSISTTRVGADRYRGHRYYWVRPSIVLVDSVGYPIKYDSTGTATELTSGPLGATSVWSFKRHMFFTTGQKVVISAPNDETNFNGVDGAAEINCGHEVYALRPFRDAMYIFGPTKIFKITGSSTTDWALETISQNLGCIAPDSIQEIGGDIIFLSQDGIRTIAGTTNIGDVDLSNKSITIEDRVNEVIQTSSYSDISSVVIPDKSQYRLFWSNSAEAAADAKGLLGSQSLSGVQINEISVDWEWFDLKGFQVACADWEYTNTSRIVVHGSYDGYVHQQEIGVSFAGTAITSILQFAWWMMDDPEIRKVLQKLSIYIRREGNPTITLGTKLDFEATNIPQPSNITLTSSLDTVSVYGVGVYGTADYESGTLRDETAEAPVVGSCFFVSFTLTTSGLTDSPYTVDGLSLEFGIGGRA